MIRKTLWLLASGATMLMLGACSSTEEPPSEPKEQSTVEAIETPVMPEPVETLPSIPTESSEPSTSDPDRIVAWDNTEIPVVSIGESVRVGDAEVTIQSVSKEASLPTDFGAIDAGDGSLFLLTASWTNHSNSASLGMCGGPEMIFVSMYDTQNREIAISYDSSMIVGNDCETRVLTGQDGTWMAAYQGLPDSVPGYAVVSDLKGDSIPHEAIVKIDPETKIDYPQ